MNRIYKSVWNAVTRSWTAVSEWQKARGKKARSLKLLPAISLLLTSPTILAYGFSNVIIGNNSNAIEGDYFFDNLPMNDIDVTVKPEVTLNDIGGVTNLFTLSNKGFEQQLGKGSVTFTYKNGYHIDPKISFNSQTSQTQYLLQNNKQVAKLTFKLGSEAYNIFNQYKDDFGVESKSFGNVQSFTGLHFKNSDASRVYDNNGLAIINNATGIWAMTLLTDIELLDKDNALELNVSGLNQQTLSARLTGDGSVKYVGNSIDNAGLNIDKVIKDQAYNNDNSYTGDTYVNNLTLNLMKDRSLGETGNLFVEKALVVVKGLEKNVGNVKVETNSALELSNNPFEVIGDLTVDDTSSLSGGNANVSVGKTLTVNSKNEGLGGEFSAADAVLGDVDALGDATLALSNSLTFQNANSEKSFDSTVTTTNALSVNVVDSKVEYAEDLSLSPTTTTIKGDSNLTVHKLDQLGAVSFAKGDNEAANTHSVLTLDMQGNGGNSWNIDGLNISNTRGDTQAIVIANGSGFEISDNTLTGFKGWLRLSNMDYSLDAQTADRFSGDLGLSIGQGATLKIDGHMELGTFGWANDGNGGVLDVTGHAHSAGDYTQDEILHVANLYLDGKGSILIDPTQYIRNTGPQTGGSVLDYDNGADSNRYVIITADKIIGDDNIELVDKNGSNSNSVTLLYNLNSQREAAEATWGYNTGKDKDKGEVYITYGLKKLNLVGSTDADASLIVNLADAKDKTLSATVEGNGIIDVVSSNANKKDVVFAGDNTFSGTVNVNDGIKLTAYTGALSGDSKNRGQVDLHLADGASVVVSTRGGAGVETQYLKSIYAVDTANVVEIKDLTELALTGTGSQLKGKLTGQGILNVLGGELSTNVSTLNAFEGELQANEGGKVALDTSADEVLTHNIAMDDTSWLIKDGSGNLSFDIKEAATRAGSKLNVRVNDGSVTLSSQTPMGNISVADGKSVNLDGLVEVTNLSGNGNLAMDVEFGSDANKGELGQAGDGLRVTEKASGDFALSVSPRDLQKGAVESIRVMEVEGDATQFELALANGLTAVQSGAYDYKLVRTDNGTGADFDLTSIAGASDHRNTTASAGAYIGIAYAAQLFDLSLHDRVGNRDWINPVTGEKQSTSLWMHHTMSHERFRDSTSQLRMRSTSNVTMLGGDVVQYTTEGNGLAYAGLMGGYGTMDTKTRSKMTDLRSKAETDAWGVGAYAGWKANKDGQTGPYVDGWLMFTHASSDVTGVDRQEENIKGEGLSASIEAGWGFKLGSVETANGKYATFTLEPHASVTWFGMEYDDLHTDAQDVKFEGKNNVRTRLGTRVNMTEEGNKTFNAFAEANWVHNTQEYGATISGLTVDQTGSRNQAEGRIGVDWRITKDLSAWARVGASFGSDNYSEREGSIGVRYQF